MISVSYKKNILDFPLSQVVIEAVKNIMPRGQGDVVLK
jgi:hypothetical protein